MKTDRDFSHRLWVSHSTADPTPATANRALIFARVRKTASIDDAALSDELAEVTLLAVNRGLMPVMIIAEAGDRQKGTCNGLDAICSAIAEDSFDVLVVRSLSRLCRSTEALRVLKALKTAGKALVVANFAGSEMLTGDELIALGCLLSPTPEERSERLRRAVPVDQVRLRAELEGNR